ncbi:uncharacterized protein K441DRAFT_695724 [Cenococcum geophilum 1.58]|uniref:uncharacterized protein n=1 Tax=Cenococcum geophilum 1.58 TaxID=794803 RepID=UPI00358FEADB|nr:hypothetical protein K441DRAFT_695724 [Cenococcum geophilum 1.58]
MFTKLPLYPYLKRDLNNYIATRYGNQTAVDILMATPDIEIFQNTMLGADINLGVHGVPRILRSSFITQILIAFGRFGKRRIRERQYALSGTSTIFNGNSTPQVTLETVQNWGFLGVEKTTKELMSAKAGTFCYEYEVNHLNIVWNVIYPPVARSFSSSPRLAPNARSWQKKRRKTRTLTSAGGIEERFGWNATTITLGALCASDAMPYALVTGSKRAGNAEVEHDV